MNPTFSRVMTMAVSGHAVAEVEQDRRGKPNLKSANRVEHPEARGTSNFLFVTGENASKTWKGLASTRNDLSSKAQRRRKTRGMDSSISMRSI